MCIRKYRSAPGQTIEIGRLDLGMPAQATDPVVEVIGRDEKDIRLPLSDSGRPGKRSARHQDEGEDTESSHQKSFLQTQIGHDRVDDSHRFLPVGLSRERLRRERELSVDFHFVVMEVDDE
jgi:hypothetical protein